MTDQTPHDKAADAVHEGRPVEAQYVRGGGMGRRILIVLLVSLSAVALLFLVIWLVSQGGLAETNVNTGTQADDVEAFDNTGTAPVPTPAPR
jgi:hypothetical protein